MGPHILQWRDLASRVGRHQVAERGGLHGKVVGHQVVQQHAEAVDVARDRRLRARQHLWRQI